MEFLGLGMEHSQTYETSIEWMGEFVVGRRQ
jgi:hypothetical protein